MTSPVLIAVRLAECVVGLTARERFEAVHQLDSSGGFMTSRGFTIAMVVVLVVSIIALLIVNLCIKVNRLKNAAKLVFSDIAAKKGLGKSETEILMDIAEKTGQKENVFVIMNEAFEHAAAALLEESYSGEKPTVETAQLEKHLAGLREKLGFRSRLDELAKSMKAADARRLAVALAELSETQIAHLSDATRCAKAGPR
jgi:hypothetical protein